MPIETVNLHVWGKCNLKCVYCYGTFPERPRSLPLASWCGILDELRESGVRRVTFSGGEPTLHPDLASMLRHARTIGLQTSIITNGARLTDDMIDLLDLVGISLDATDEDVLGRLGRRRPGDPSYVEHTARIARRVRSAGGRLKINTVVTALNANENLTDTLLELRPDKWKPMQFTFVPGENDRSADALRIDEQTFEEFVQRHVRVAQAGIWVEAESEQTIASTYVMIDPEGRVFQHAPGGHRLSRPVLDMGIRQALREAGGYDRARFEARGGHVDIRRLPVVGGGAS